MIGTSTRSRAMRLVLLTACLWPAAASALEMSSSYVLPMSQNQNFNLDAESAAVADANGDGRMDVAFFATGWGSSDPRQDFVAYVYEQQANGTMALATQFSLAPSGVARYYARAAAMADLDGDGKAEMMLKTANANDDAVAILSRNAAGAYVEATRIPCPLPVKQILTRDFDRDGHVDILVQSYGNGLSVHWGRGGLAYSRPMYVLGYVARDVLFADVDNDGIDDLLSSALTRDAGVDSDNGAAAFGVSYGLSNDALPVGGSYDFTEPAFIDAPGLGGSVAFGTFPGTNGNGVALWYEETEYPNAEHPHYILFHQNIAILSRQDRDHFAVTRQFRYQSGISRHYGSPVVTEGVPALRAVDFDDDGDDDLVVFDPKHIEILLQEADGFAPVYVVPDNSNAAGNEYPLISAANIADFNGDGCSDIGYLNRSYVINYRVDCPTAATGKTEPATTQRQWGRPVQKKVSTQSTPQTRAR